MDRKKKIQHKKDVLSLVKYYFPRQNLKAPLPQLENLLGALKRPKPLPGSPTFPTYNPKVDEAILVYLDDSLLTSKNSKDLYLKYLLDTESLWVYKLQELIGKNFPPLLPTRDSYKDQYENITYYISKYGKIFLERISIFGLDFGNSTLQYFRDLIKSNKKLDDYLSEYMHHIVKYGSVHAMDLLVEKEEDFEDLCETLLFGSLKNFVYVYEKYPKIRKGLKLPYMGDIGLDKIEYLIKNISKNKLDSFVKYLTRFSGKKLFGELKKNHRDFLETYKEAFTREAFEVHNLHILEYFLVENRPDFKISYGGYLPPGILGRLIEIGGLKFLNLHELAKHYFLWRNDIATDDEELKVFLKAISWNGDSLRDLEDYGILEKTSQFPKKTWEHLLGDLYDNLSLESWKGLISKKLDLEVLPRKRKATIMKKILPYHELPPERLKWLEDEVDRRIEALKKKK